MAVVYLNGRFVPPAQARVAVTDFGLQLGIGLFETLRAYNGFVFALDAHVQRLLASAETLQIPLAVTPDVLCGAVRETLQANALRDARLRLTVTAGRRPDTPSPTAPASPADTATADSPTRDGLPTDGIASDARPNADQPQNSTAAPLHTDDQPPGPTVIVTAEPFQPYPKSYYSEGVSVVIADSKQNPSDLTAGHKTLNYFGRMLALNAARRLGATEALFFTPTNHLACGAITNVFVFDGQQLLTADRTTGALPGITRAAVLRLAAQEGLPAQTVPDLTIRQLLEAPEVFVTNSLMELVPVVRIEKHTVGDGRPGPHTTRLLDAYRQITMA